MSTIDRLAIFFVAILTIVGVGREIDYWFSSQTVPPLVVVSVSGAVRSPGVISLPAEARMIHAIEECGGLTFGADIQALDLARPLKDGDHLFIAVRQPALEVREFSSKAVAASSSEQVEAMAKPLEDSSYAQKEVTYKTKKNRRAVRKVEPIDLNKASLEELQAIPFMGKVKAQAIVAARQNLPGGSFHSLEELLGIRGIKRKTFERLKPYLKIEGT